MSRAQIDKHKLRINRYEDILSYLINLPNKTRYDIVVPIQPMTEEKESSNTSSISSNTSLPSILGSSKAPPAFFFGEMIHTNELMVLLGENTFVERSASETKVLIDQRIQRLGDKIKELKESISTIEVSLIATSNSKVIDEGDKYVLTQTEDGIVTIQEDEDIAIDLTTTSNNNNNNNNNNSENKVKVKETDYDTEISKLEKWIQRSEAFAGADPQLDLDYAQEEYLKHHYLSQKSTQEEGKDEALSDPQTHQQEDQGVTKGPRDEEKGENTDEDEGDDLEDDLEESGFYDDDVETYDSPFRRRTKRVTFSPTAEIKFIDTNETAFASVHAGASAEPLLSPDLTVPKSEHQQHQQHQQPQSTTPLGDVMERTTPSFSPLNGPKSLISSFNNTNHTQFTNPQLNSTNHPIPSPKKPSKFKSMLAQQPQKF